MPASTTPIFPNAPTIGIATLTSPTAITSRANITGTTGLTQLTPVSTNGKRIDGIRVKGKATNSATNVFVWLYNGTTSHLIDEIDVAAITVGNTTDSVSVVKVYSDTGLVLPPTYQLYVSVSVAADLNILALSGDY